MATPVIHASIGIIISSAYLCFASRSTPYYSRKVLFAGAVLACLADIDILYSFIITGDPLKMHFGITHTLFFSLFIALLVRALSTWRYSLWAFLLVFSHVLIDGLSGKELGFNPTHGVRLFAPFFNNRFSSEITLFHGVQHAKWFSALNMRNLFIDILIYFPISFFTIYLIEKKLIIDSKNND
jgi:membrane-bound metal-dependent hydrolase YbcI (DUF457 family)